MELMEARRIILTQGKTLGYVWYSSAAHISLRQGCRDGTPECCIISNTKSPPRSKRGAARSGSITEQIVDAGGIKKTVLEMTSSFASGEGGAQVQTDESLDVIDDRKEKNQPGNSKKKKRRRRAKKGGAAAADEDTPLLGNGH